MIPANIKHIPMYPSIWPYVFIFAHIHGMGRSSARDWTCTSVATWAPTSDNTGSLTTDPPGNSWPYFFF